MRPQQITSGRSLMMSLTFIDFRLYYLMGPYSNPKYIKWQSIPLTRGVRVWSRRIQNTSKLKGIKTWCKGRHDEEIDKSFPTSLEQAQTDFVRKIYCYLNFFPNRAKGKDKGDMWNPHRRTHDNMYKVHVVFI